MINREPYKDPANDDRWTLDVDADDEVNYVADVRQWVTDSVTEVASFDPIVVGATLLMKGTPQGDRNGLLPVKLKVHGTGTDEPHCTFRSTTEDGQQFDRTMWFNLVTN